MQKRLYATQTGRKFDRTFARTAIITAWILWIMLFTALQMLTIVTLGLQTPGDI